MSRENEIRERTRAKFAQMQPPAAPEPTEDDTKARVAALERALGAKPEGGETENG